MKIEKSTKKDMLSGYNFILKKLYQRYPNTPPHQLRLQFLEVVTSHICSKSLEAVTTAKRVTKHKVTKMAKQIHYEEKCPPNTSMPTDLFGF